MSEKRFFCRRKTIIDGTTILRAEDIVNLLNNLVDENEQLRKKLGTFQELCATLGAELICNGFEIEIDGKSLTELIADE